MEIELKEITVAELTNGYEDNGDNGVVGYSKRLDIRPPYQREFIYKDAQRDAVIDTIIKVRPLNVMYWAVRDDGNFEVIDGQQRTISIAQFVSGQFSFNDRGFSNLQKDERQQLLDYKLMVYLCTGTDSEKLEWFKTINIAGLKLTDQELRNAVYHGTWTTDAKRHFSKSGSAAYNLAHQYVSGTAIRQEYLETAIKWINNNDIEQYMAQHQHDPNANELWLHFQKIINWVQVTFPTYRKEMKGIAWGELYQQYHHAKLDAAQLENEIAALMADDDVTNKKGVYQFVLTREERYLNIRAFTDNQKREAYERQQGICPICNKHFLLESMEADHITPWSEGGKTDAKNCQMLCKDDNRRKSNR